MGKFFVVQKRGGKITYTRGPYSTMESAEKHAKSLNADGITIEEMATPNPRRRAPRARRNPAFKKGDRVQVKADHWTGQGARSGVVEQSGAHKTFTLQDDGTPMEFDNRALEKVSKNPRARQKNPHDANNRARSYDIGYADAREGRTNVRRDRIESGYDMDAYDIGVNDCVHNGDASKAKTSSRRNNPRPQASSTAKYSWTDPNTRAREREHKFTKITDAAEFFAKRHARGTVKQLSIPGDGTPAVTLRFHDGTSHTYHLALINPRARRARQR